MSFVHPSCAPGSELVISDLQQFWDDLRPAKLEVVVGELVEFDELETKLPLHNIREASEDAGLHDMKHHEPKHNQHN
jgi:hypothetical protein